MQQSKIERKNKSQNDRYLIYFGSSQKKGRRCAEPIRSVKLSRACMPTAKAARPRIRLRH
jgi:hypothetical protein